jgi:hypothetical protein
MEAWSTVFAGLAAMPLDEPSLDFNTAVLRRIPALDRAPARVARSQARRRWVATGGLLLAAASLVLLLLPAAGTERLPLALSGGFVRALDAMEWLSVSSAQGALAVVDVLTEWKIAQILLAVAGVLLGAVSTTVTDPVFVLFVTAMAMLSAGSGLVMTRLIRPKLNGATVNGTRFPMGG